jgi:hypothetical protein
MHRANVAWAASCPPGRCPALWLGDGIAAAAARVAHCPSGALIQETRRFDPSLPISAPAAVDLLDFLKPNSSRKKLIVGPAFSPTGHFFCEPR